MLWNLKISRLFPENLLYLSPECHPCSQWSLSFLNRSSTTRHVSTAQTDATGTDQEVPLSMVGSLDARASYIPKFCVGRMGIMFKEALRIIR